MSLVRCTCCRDRLGQLVVLDPECEAMETHLRVARAAEYALPGADVDEEEERP